MTALDMAFLMAAEVEAKRLAALAKPAPLAPAIHVETLVIQAQRVVLSSAEDYTPIINVAVAAPVVYVAAPSVTVTPNVVATVPEVRAIVQLPERKARKVVIDGPDGAWKGQIG